MVYAANISTEPAKWQAINIDFVGPLLDEAADSPNPFLDYRLTVNLTSPTGRVTVVPGFFAGDGQGGARGQVWRVRFSADEVGWWTYRAQLRSGNQIAISLDNSAGTLMPLEGAVGQFDVGEIPADASGFLRLGRLEYVGQHYLKFRDGPYWIKGGTDSPENLLAFAGIDGTVDQGGLGDAFLHDYTAHRADWLMGDPLFNNSSTGIDSRGLIGALNYLGQQGVNSVYFLPMNLGGDGQDTYPFIDAEQTRYSKTHFDISKLYHWNKVFNHAQAQGIALNIVLSETEEANERWLDNGALGVERKLFFRELIARFGYLLAVKWNLGEENDFRLEELQKHASYIRALDWSKKPIAVHTHINQFYRYGELVGDNRFSASSIQYNPQFAGQFVEQWRNNSAQAGHPWVIDMDENTNGLADDGVASRRKEILYDVFFSGGNIEWYFGYHPMPLGGDITAGNFRLRETMWTQMRYAREMMQRELPFWEMEPADDLVSDDSDEFGGAEVFALKGEVYAVYLPKTNGRETLDISGTNFLYRQRWFDPRTGQMIEGNDYLASSGRLPLGPPPSLLGEDWVTLVSRSDAGLSAVAQDNSNDAPRFLTIPSPRLDVGQRMTLTLTATDNDGTYPVVSVRSVPPGMQVAGLGNGQIRIDWTVPASATAQSIVELVAIDARNAALSNVQRMIISVNPVEQAQADTALPDQQNVVGAKPYFSGLPQPVVNAGDRLNLRIQATDDSGLAPVVSVGRVPHGMKVYGPGNGVLELRWLVPENLAAQTIVELLAFDPYDPAVRTVQRLLIRSGTATPAHAPQLTAIEPQSIVAGQTLSFRVKADDADGYPPALTVLNAPDNSAFHDNGDGTRTFSWRTRPEDAGRHVLKFVARDHDVPELFDTLDVIVQLRP